MRRWASLLAVAAVGVCCAEGVADESVLPLRVLYVGNAKSPRAVDHEAFLKKHFKQVSVAEREYRIEPARVHVGRAGLIDLRVRNTGRRPHGLVLVTSVGKLQTGTIQPGRSADIRVRRLVVAVDVGEVINPDGVANQMEGGAIQATSWTLKEAVRFDRQRITSDSVVAPRSP